MHALHTVLCVFLKVRGVLFLVPSLPSLLFALSCSFPPPPFAAGKRMKVRSWGRDRHISFLLFSILSRFHHKFSPFKLYFFVLKISTALWRSLSHTASQGPTSDQLVRHDVIRRPPWTAVTWWHWLLAKNTPLARIGRWCPQRLQE